MAKVIFELFMVLCLFSSLDSISVVNNVTVSSDFFQEQFFKELWLISNRSAIIRSGDDNDSKCVSQLQEIVNQLPKMSVLPFIDSWGGLPSGILYGHLTDYGNYDQCVDTIVTLDENLGTATGQYCFVSIPTKLSSKSFELVSPRHRELQVEERITLPEQSLRFGICIPDTCSPQLINEIFQNGLKKVVNGTFSNVIVSDCSVRKKPDFGAADIFAIVLFSSIGLMMLLSTLYDAYTSHLEKQPVPVLLAFSVITNCRKMMMINTKTSANSIDCLIGIRVLSMVWVVYCHLHSSYSLISLTNSIDILSWLKSVYAMTVLSGTVSVDSFFFLSGLLVAWLGLKELDKTKGKLNVVMMYVHRYIRLTPPLAALILFYATLNKYMGSGPLRPYFLSMLRQCETSWWKTLLYIQNYAYDNLCVSHSWYLAVDMQLYILSPFVLIPLWKWGKKCVCVLIVLSLLSMGCVIATYIVEGYTDLLGLEGINQWEKTYATTHTRYPVWLIGICVGYFMHLNKHSTFRPPMVIRLIGWTLCFGTILSIVFAPYGTLSSSSPISVGEAAAYESLKRVSWSIALTWIVVACHYGFGGIVNSILSHPIWQPFGRLNYSMYVIHVAVITYNFGTVRTDYYFSSYRLMLAFWSSFGITLLAAAALSLSFEAPVLVIEKAIFGRAPSKKTSIETPAPSAPNEISSAEEKKV